MVSRDKVIVILLTAWVVSIRICTFITAPLWQDSLKVTFNHHDNYSTNASGIPWSGITINTTETLREVDPYFCAFSQAFFSTIFYGTGYVIILVFFPHHITTRERSYPHTQLVATGAAQAMSATFMNLCLSGTRTAPYLVALLGNFLVPIQFTTRLIVLRKRPTLRKFLCALAVIIGELISLIPSIFPSLEPASERGKDGGASGAGAILWPLAFLFSLIPGTVVNVFMERSVKKDKTDPKLIEAEEDPNANKYINMFFYQFWICLWTVVVTLYMFWLALLPGVGTVPSIQILGERFRFNFACMFGAGECHPNVIVLAWITTSANVMSLAANGYMLRYSEGANYFTVAQTLRSPILLLFWTLFHENPFYWNPHVYLTTYLAITALCIMVPAVHIYNTGPPEKSVSRILPKFGDKEDTEQLLDDESNSPNVDENDVSIQ